MTQTLTILGGIVSALITGVIAYAIAGRNARATATSAMTAPYEKLADRVDKLEDKDAEKSRTIATLRDHLEVVIRDRDTIVSYVRSLGVWFQGGAKPPAPTMPAFLAQHLDPGSFDIARVTEVTRSMTTRYAVSEHHDPSPEED